MSQSKEIHYCPTEQEVMWKRLKRKTFEDIILYGMVRNTSRRIYYISAEMKDAN